MTAIKKGMLPGICDTRANVPYIVFADYKNKTCAEEVKELETRLDELGAEYADD